MRKLATVFLLVASPAFRMKRIAIALLLLAAATISYATKTVPAYTEQDVTLSDVWRMTIARATFQDPPAIPGDPPPPSRQGLAVQYAYEIRDENGVVRRRGTFAKEVAPVARFNELKAWVQGDLPDINASEGF